MARPVALIGGVTLLFAFRAFSVFFAVDDFSPLSRLQNSSFPSPTDLFARRYLSSDGLFAVVHSVVGLDFRWYHLPPLVFHAGSALLLAAIVRMACPRLPALGLIAAVVFSIHPAAYTPLVWLSAGFNETPALFFGFLSVWCALRYVQGGHWGLIAGAGVAVAVGAAFKQTALLAPSYFVPLACVLPMPAGHTSVMRIRRLVLIGLPMLAFQLWYLLVVWPEARELFAGPYDPILTPGSLLATFGTLAAHALNPLFFLRFDIGYQGPIPSSFAPTPDGLTSLAAGGLLAFGIVVLSAWAARGLQIAPLAVALGVALVGSLSWAAPLALHLQGYYSYFALPAASTLIALPVLYGWRLLTADHRANVIQRYAVILCVIVWIVIEGAVLHDVNRLVRQAEHAGLTWQFVAERPALRSLYFVPPSGTAYNDTTYGRAFQVMRPTLPPAVHFAELADVPDRFAPIEGEAMLALDDLGTGVWRLFDLDSAVWQEAPTPVTLRTPREALLQPLVVRQSLQALHVRARGFGMHSALRYQLVRRAGSGGVVEIVEGELHLAGAGEHYLNVPLDPGLPLPAGRYILTLQVSPEYDGAAQLLLASAATGNTPHSRFRDAQGRVTTLDGALVHRIVKDTLQPPCVGPVSSFLGLCAR